MRAVKVERVLLCAVLLLFWAALAQNLAGVAYAAPAPAPAGASAQAPLPCVGSPFPGVPVDVTSMMSAPPASGVAVRMVTGWDGSAPTNTPNFPTNSDVIIHSPKFDSLIFNHGFQFGSFASADGWNQQMAAPKGGAHVRPAPDGLGFIQPGGGPAKTDPQWTDLTDTGNCQTVTLANKGYANLASNNGVPTSLPVMDPSHNNVHLVTWAPDGWLHRVYSDGTFVCDGGEPNCPGTNPPDGFAASQGYHRLRENNQFPHWLHYTRTGDTVQRLWLYNFDTKQSCYLPHGNHDDNSLDGSMYAVQDPGLSFYFVFKILDSKGNLLSNVGCSGAGPLTINGIAQSKTVCTAGAPGWCASVGTLPNQLAGSPRMGADFCSFSYNGAFLFCVAGSRPFPGHQLNEHDLYMVVPNTGFATVPTSETVTYLAPTDGHQAGTYEGVPVPNSGFVDANGVTHTYFRSDKMWEDLARTIQFTYNPKGKPELFEVTFTR